MKSDPKQEKQDAKAKHQAERDRLLRAWRRDGFNPWAHLEGIAGEGEIGLLLAWGGDMRHFVDGSWATREQKVSAVLAMWDIREIVDHLGGRSRGW